MTEADWPMCCSGPAADKFKAAAAAQQAGEEQLAAAVAQAAALQREVDGREHTIGWLEGQVGGCSWQLHALSSLRAVNWSP